jgi:hypothetical protein
METCLYHSSGKTLGNAVTKMIIIIYRIVTSGHNLVTRPHVEKLPSQFFIHYLTELFVSVITTTDA